jgi:hypothetical protein
LQFTVYVLKVLNTLVYLWFARPIFFLKLLKLILKIDVVLLLFYYYFLWGSCSVVNVNIRMDLVEVGWGDVDWIGLAEDRDKWRALVNAVTNLRVP